MKRSKVTRRSCSSGAYAKAGVNIAAGDAFSGYAGEIGRASFGNSPFVEVVDESRGHFRGPRGWRHKMPDKDCFEVAAPDGIGTATIIVSAAGAHSTSSSRLVAMTGDDIGRHGGASTVFVNILGTKTLGQPGSALFENYQTMMSGLGTTARKQSFVLMGGETAELPHCVSSELVGPITETSPICNWDAVMIGINHPDKVICGNRIRPGQRIIALRDGFGSNGASLLRKYLRKKYGDTWWLNQEAQREIEDMATPATIYGRFLAEMNGWFDPSFKTKLKMHAIGHITGGGIKGKFWDDILHRGGHSAILDNLWEPPGYMADCVKTMEVSSPDGYETFNGGQRLLVVVDESDVDRFCEHAHKSGLEAQDAGYIDIRRREPRCEITSKFTGRTFTYR